MALERELDTYKRELPNLLDKAGKYVLIHEDQVSVWCTYEDALQEGYRIFGLKPFLVKQIQTTEQIHHVTRDIQPVCQS
jgi:hypothetical protein